MLCVLNFVQRFSRRNLILSLAFLLLSLLMMNIFLCFVHGDLRRFRKIGTVFQVGVRGKDNVLLCGFILKQAVEDRRNRIGFKINQFTHCRFLLSSFSFRSAARQPFVSPWHSVFRGISCLCIEAWKRRRFPDNINIPLFHIISSICVPQKCKSDNYFATLFCNILLQV